MPNKIKKKTHLNALVEKAYKNIKSEPEIKTEAAINFPSSRNPVTQCETIEEAGDQMYRMFTLGESNE